MTACFERIMAIAVKEWRLNLRFATEYFVGSLINPLKSSLLMLLLYSGFFRSGDFLLGSLTKENYPGYVLLGSILHSQLSNGAGILSGKLMSEKYWQTSLATLLSPASIYDVLLGFAIGSGGMSILVNIVILAVVTLFYPVPFTTFLLGALAVSLIAIFGFGIGLIGATIGLVWEGKLFVYFYGVQAITFLSCLYYPIQIIPKFLHPIISFMPTYQLGELLHRLYFGPPMTQIFIPIVYMVVTCSLIVTFAGYLYNHSVRKYGIVGY